MPSHTVRDHGLRLWRGWDRFWFAEVSSSNLALIRVVLGTLVTLWALTLLPSAGAFFSGSAIVPDAHSNLGNGVWTALGGDPSVGLVYTLVAALIVAGACVAIGYRTRLATAVVFVCLISLERRNPYVFNAGDWLLRISFFYLLFADWGASFSVDRRRRDPAGWATPATVSAWPLRMLQLQVSAVYLFGAWAKVRSTAWNDGTAFGIAVRISDVERFPFLGWTGTSITFSSALTYGVVALELALAIGVWWPRARPWLLLAGASMHLGIDLTIRVGFFSYVIITLYLAFLAPAIADRVIATIARRMTIVRSRWGPALSPSARAASR